MEVNIPYIDPYIDPMEYDYLDGGNSIIFYVHPEPWGNDPIFDKHIFQTGWFNHQLVIS